MMKLGSEGRRVATFGAVGVAAWAVYTAAVAIVVESGGDTVVGVVAGFILGTAVSFFGNCRWVFKAPASAMVGQRFLVTTLAGLALNIALAWLLTRWGVHYFVMTLIIFSIVPVFNYLGHRFWTFAQPKPAR